MAEFGSLFERVRKIDAGWFEFLRPRAVWINKHTADRTTITDFAARIERIPDPDALGFKDDPQLVVHHSANVPPGQTKGFGDDCRAFIEHWQPLDLTTCGETFSCGRGTSSCELVYGHDGPHALPDLGWIETTELTPEAP